MVDFEFDVVIDEGPEKVQSIDDGPDKAPSLPELEITLEDMSECLSHVGQIPDAVEFAFLSLDSRDRAITSIRLLEKYVHLQNVDLSNNNITDLTPLAHLKYLLILKLHHNLITSTSDLSSFSHLQVLDLSFNLLKSTVGIRQPRLKHLNLTSNPLKKIHLSSEDLPELQILELRNCNQDSIKDINVVTIKKLFLAQNNISSLENMHRFSQLTTLHLRDNRLESLRDFSSASSTLAYLNLRENSISSIEEMKHLPKNLQILVMLDNPVSNDAGYRDEVMDILPQLKRIDKETVDEDFD